MAHAVMTGIKNTKENKTKNDKTENVKLETVCMFGGGHYPKIANKLILGSEFVIGHIAPKYAIDSIDEEMFKQAVEKNVEKVAKIIIVKDETSAKQRQKLVGFADKMGVKYEMI